MIGAWDSAHRTDERTQLRSWIFAILCNACRKHQRARSRRSAHERLAGAAWAQRQARSEDLRIEPLRAALASLPNELREVVVLRFLEGLSVAEAAVAAGIPEGTVKSRTHGALQRLQHLIGRAT